MICPERVLHAWLPGEEPSSGALATGPDGAPLLVLHSKAAQKAVAVQLLGQNAQEQSAKVRGMPGLASLGQGAGRGSCNPICSTLCGVLAEDPRWPG